MLVRIIAVIIGCLFLIPISFSSPALSCEVRAGACEADESVVFNLDGTINANVHTWPNDPWLYSHSLCCKSELMAIDFHTVSSAANCPSQGSHMMYLTGDTNSRVAFATKFNAFHHPFQLCSNPSNPDSKLELEIVSPVLESEFDAYVKNGYTCMFRVDGLVNSKVSTCDATFNGGDQYPYSVFGTVHIEGGDFSCNPDCTGLNDGRVYKACSSVIEECKLVPNECDGALKGTVIQLNATHSVECNAPWNVVERAIFTTDELDINSIEGECEDLIKVELGQFFEQRSGEKIVGSVVVCLDE